MENPNQMKTAEPGVLLPMNELTCGDNVCIPRSRYDELIRAEMEREILFHAYQLMGAFSMEPVMDSVFNPKFKHQRETSISREAGVGDAE